MHSLSLHILVAIDEGIDVDVTKRFVRGKLQTVFTDISLGLSLLTVDKDNGIRRAHNAQPKCPTACGVAFRR